MTQAAETSTPVATETAAGPGLISRLLGVLVSPRSAYAAVAARPRVLGALVVTLAITAGAQAGFLSTEVGKEALIDQQTKAMDGLRRLGLNIPDAAYDQLEARAASAPYTTAASIVIVTPIFYTIITAVLLAIFNALLGGTATFKQVYAILVHSAVIGCVQQLFTIPINYARGEIGSPAQLSVFLPMLDDMGFVYYFLTAIDLFIIWMIVSSSIGLAVLYKRRTGPIATAQMAVYVVIALIIAAVRAS